MIKEEIIINPINIDYEFWDELKKSDLDIKEAYEEYVRDCIDLSESAD